MEEKNKEKGRRTKKNVIRKKAQRGAQERRYKGEHKREDTKGRAQAKKITKTAKVRVLYWNVVGLRKKR
jgi:hypothetical protein